jgi:hypothetical protein
MARSQCQKCGGFSFEVTVKEPSQSPYKMLFVQCSGCGTPIGTTEYYNAGVLMKEQEAKINGIEQRLYNMELILNSINNRIK